MGGGRKLYLRELKRYGWGIEKKIEEKKKKKGKGGVLILIKDVDY